MLKSKKQLDAYKKDYAAAVQGMRLGKDAEHLWQFVAEELQEFQAIAKELTALMPLLLQLRAIGAT